MLYYSGKLSAEELVVAQQLGFEKISDEDFIPSEMYGGYSIKELVDNTLRIINSNLDEGQLYADYRFAEMCESNYLKGRFNQFYDLKPEDQYYIEWDEEA